MHDDRRQGEQGHKDEERPRGGETAEPVATAERKDPDVEKPAPETSPGAEREAPAADEGRVAAMPPDTAPRPQAGEAERVEPEKASADVDGEAREAGSPAAEEAPPPPSRGALLARVVEGARSRREGWLWFAAVLGIFAAALLWRWHFASRAKVYTYDSYYYMLLARSLRHGFSYSVAGHPHYKYMPMYPICVAAFDLFLPLETAGKLSNLVFNAACVFPIYALGALVFGRRAGLAAAGLFAFEPISSVWAAVPMSDGLLALLVCLAAFFFLKWFKMEEGRARHLYLSAAAAGLALLTRWEGALLLLLMGAFLLYAWAKRRVRFVNLLIFAAIALAPFALYSLRNLITFGTPLKSAYLEELRNHPEWAEYTTPNVRFFRYLFFADIPPLGISSRYCHYGYLLFGYAGLAFSLAVKRYRRYGLFLAGWLLLLGPTHFFWYFSNVRFLIPAVPALCLGAGVLIGMPWARAERGRTGLAFAAVLLLLVVCVVGVLALTGRPLANDRFYSNIAALESGEGGLATLEAVEWLKENAGDAGVASRMAPMASFYLGREVYFIGEYQGFEPADLRIDHVVEDARAKGVRYILLWSYEPDVEGAMAYSGQGPDVAEQLRLVGRWEAAPSNQWNRATYAWVFEVPPE